MTPRLAEIIARMVEAVLAAEDSAAGGGNISHPRELPNRPVALKGPKRHSAKEATR
ncbi:MAG: hypothetical protein ACHQ01_04190 [Candidatus Limnocylindrales bacterium]